jgi:hypothetical protein
VMRVHTSAEHCPTALAKPSIGRTRGIAVAGGMVVVRALLNFAVVECRQAGS